MIEGRLVPLGGRKMGVACACGEKTGIGGPRDAGSAADGSGAREKTSKEETAWKAAVGIV